ncbi:class I SAM-dependent methyltransferase [Alkalilimnicola ehrlichii]|uniref:class I SAM-dependent methyltransferase n=1 Tax=Alkalilimnicola ehrlichii TaxID=351052 RepID=UPI003BA2B0CA
MRDSSFEQRWRRRFAQRGAQLDDDAGIAGWTPTGLAGRVRQFRTLWSMSARAPGRWLDIGCGAGTYTRLLHAEGHQVAGLDYSAPSLHKARARSAAGIPWLAANIRQLPLADGVADGVLCFGVMQALARPDEALAEMHRVLKPGGEVWVDALNARCLPTAWREYRRQRAGAPPHLRYDHPDEFLEAARVAGLEPLHLHWLPLLPARLAPLQGVAEWPGTRRVMEKIPTVGARLSHSFILRARRPLER